MSGNARALAPDACGTQSPVPSPRSGRLKSAALSAPTSAWAGPTGYGCAINNPQRREGSRLTDAIGKCVRAPSWIAFQSETILTASSKRACRMFCESCAQ